MNITTQLAWRNLWRNPRRSILTLLAIILSCVFLIFMASFQNGSYNEMIKTAVGTTGEIQIQVKGFQDDPDIRKTIQSPQAIVQGIQSVPGVGNVTTRAEAFALVSSDSQSAGVLIQGVEPDREANISPMDDTISSGTWFTDNPYEVVIGQALANNLELDVGKELVVIGQGWDGSTAASVFTVVGIFKSGYQEADRNLIAVPLSTLQETFFLGDRVHRIVINSQHFEKPEHLAENINQWLEAQGFSYKAYPWSELLPGLRESIKLDKVSASIMYVILLVIIAFSISNTFLMAILERTYEFGVMLAIGTGRSRLLRMLFLETSLLATLGILLGIAFGMAITGYYQNVGIDFGEAAAMMAEYGMPTRLHPRMNLITVLIGPLFVLLFTLISASYPILKVRKLAPVKAMRTA